MKAYIAGFSQVLCRFWRIIVIQTSPAGVVLYITPAMRRREGIRVSEIRIKDNESLDSALRRFKRQCARAGVLQEVRKREHYEKPSVKRKKKSEAARKRKFK